MKRVRKSAITPKKLAAFIANRPTADWDDFKGKRGRYKEVAQQLRVDQHNLCALLRLDAPRLRRWRKEIMEALSDQIAALMQNGTDIDAARQAVAQAVFADQFPRFFTCVRWYLGMAAEAELQRLAYQG